MRRVLVVGASGLIGSHVVSALASRAEVMEASQGSADLPVDISDSDSIQAMFDRVGPVDGVVCAAGMARWLPLAETTDQDWAFSLANKLMGQVNLVRYGLTSMNDGGCFVLTTGYLAQHPVPGSSIVTTVNSAVEGFVRASALEVGRGVRVNAVSPVFASETLVSMGMDPAGGVPAAQIAERFVELLDGDVSGAVLPAGPTA